MSEGHVMAAGNLSARAPIYQAGTGNVHQSLTSNKKLPNLPVVPKPTAHPQEYDTYECRLATYYDWPSGVPVTPEDLARAGFYYTHYADKVKCPYCFGGIYNWEPTDNVFSEHVRHNPKCEFMKYKAYETLSAPVPVISTDSLMATSVAKQQPFEEQPSVKAVLALGYSIYVIRQVARNNYNGQLRDTSLSSDTILDRIFELQRKVGISLANYEGQIDSSENASHIEGAVSQLNLKDEIENNGELLPSSDYASLDIDTDNAEETSMESVATGNDIRSNVLPTKNTTTRKTTNTSPTDENVKISTNEKAAKSAHGNVDKMTNGNVAKSTNAAIKSRSTPDGGESVQFDDPEYQRLKAEHRALKSSAMCGGCHMRGVDCLFLPCRHLVACEECAERMEDCPQCDAEIIGTVKVFLT